MNDKKRKALEAAGYRVGDASDFLGLSEEERELVELRAAVSAAVRERRTERNLTQAKLADLLRSSQSRVAKIEAGSSDVSLDAPWATRITIRPAPGPVAGQYASSNSSMSSVRKYELT